MTRLGAEKSHVPTGESRGSFVNEEQRVWWVWVGAETVYLESAGVTGCQGRSIKGRIIGKARAVNSERDGWEQRGNFVNGISWPFTKEMKYRALVRMPQAKKALALTSFVSSNMRAAASGLLMVRAARGSWCPVTQSHHFSMAATRTGLCSEHHRL